MASGGDLSAKDFRTWSATVVAAVALADKAQNVIESKAGRKRTINEAIEGVAFYLGNTPTVARSSYIDPRVFDRFLSGWTIDPVLANNGSPRRRGHPSTRRAIEKAVLDLLTDAAQSPSNRFLETSQLSDAGKPSQGFCLSPANAVSRHAELANSRLDRLWLLTGDAVPKLDDLPLFWWECGERLPERLLTKAELDLLRRRLLVAGESVGDRDVAVISGGGIEADNDAVGALHLSNLFER
jgi:hypothetical protein